MRSVSPILVMPSTWFWGISEWITTKRNPASNIQAPYMVIILSADTSILSDYNSLSTKRFYWHKRQSAKRGENLHNWFSSKLKSFWNCSIFEIGILSSLSSFQLLMFKPFIFHWMPQSLLNTTTIVFSDRLDILPTRCAMWAIQRSLQLWISKWPFRKLIVS